MLLRFCQFLIAPPNSNYSHLLHHRRLHHLILQHFSTATTTLYLNFPTRDMNGGSSSFSSLGQSSRSEGRGRGQFDIGGRGRGQSDIGGRGRGQYDIGGRGRGQSDIGGGGRGQPDTRGRGRGSTGGRHGAVAGGVSDRIDALGRLVVRILRHTATELNLDMRSDGYLKVDDLLKLNLKTRANIPLRSHSIDEVLEAVQADNKQRLGLLEENGQLFIRANQGHSVAVVETESLLKPITSAEDIPVCVHGTYKKFLDSILRTGLKRMTRLHVHFSSGLPSDGEVISGMRRDINTIIYLDVNKALEDGMKLYVSENKVILTEGFGGVVPAKYFLKIQSWPSRKPVPIKIDDVDRDLSKLNISN